MNANQRINCQVTNCRFNDEGEVCSLPSIEVGNTSREPNCCAETECDSFEV